MKPHKCNPWFVYCFISGGVDKKFPPYLANGNVGESKPVGESSRLQPPSGASEAVTNSCQISLAWKEAQEKGEKK